MDRHSKSTARGFWAFAKARHQIYLHRAAGKRPPWTSDPILGAGRFTNVYRELDRTTIHFANLVRGKAPDVVSEVMNTAIYRWFNFIPSCQRLYEAGCFQNVPTPGNRFAADNVRLAMAGASKIVTGSYIIKTPNGMNKLEGLIWCIDELEKLLLRLPLAGNWATLYEAWEDLKKAPYLGDFMAYEIVTDLRHTVLKDAGDTMDWANPGPGCMRGINRVLGVPLKRKLTKDEYIEFMQVMLGGVQARAFEGFSNIPLELRDIEHTFCEYDKYERIRLDGGRLKNRYTPS